MDIHAPIARVESFKEIAKHVLIVTIGILIALGLEGIRESWREHVAVSEVRERFNAELTFDREHLNLDQENVRKTDAQLDQIIADMPRLSKSPEELDKRVRALQPSFYFFSTNAWETAMSSGVLVHMRADELDRYVEAYLGIRNYKDLSASTIPQWVAVESYFQSHRSYTPTEAAVGEEKLRTLKMNFMFLEHVAKETSAGLDEALKAR
jgi:hypothetical protein